jgi:uncharacterized membrane protein
MSGLKDDSQEDGVRDSLQASREPEDTSSAAISLNVEKRLAEAAIHLKPEVRKKVGLVVERVIEESQFFSGPQPPPALLQEYERICPGWAEKLLQMGASEQQHRHECDRKELEQSDQMIALDHRDASYAMTGMVFGFVILLVILGIGVYALGTGHPNVAMTCIGSGVLAAVARVFINGRSPKSPADVSKDSRTNQTQAPPPTGQKRKNR